jgi:hypothetical protein
MDYTFAGFIIFVLLLSIAFVFARSEKKMYGDDSFKEEKQNNE